MEKVMINLTAGRLKEILADCPDDMDVIIPVIEEDNANAIHGFRHVRTVGLLEEAWEHTTALCLNAAADGLDISSQVKEYDSESITCKKILF